MKTIKIVPTSFSVGTQHIANITQIHIRNVVIRELNGWAQIYHDFYDEDGNIIASREYKLMDEDYNSWGLDDNYIVNKLLDFYNLEEK